MVFPKIVLECRNSKTVFQITILECLVFKIKIKIENSKTIFQRTVLDCLFKTI